MQKLVGLVVLPLFIGSVKCNAQRLHQHEIQISCGPLARPQLLEDFVTSFVGIFFGETGPELEFSTFYAATYRYQAHRRMSIGVTSGITNGSTFKTDYSHLKSFYKHTNGTMAFETEFIIADRPIVKLYAITALGVHVIRVKDHVQTKTYAWPTCQITPFGIRYGRKLGAFAEIGYGYKGIVNFGLSARL